MSVIFLHIPLDMYLYFQGKLSLAEEYHQRFGLKSSLYLECSHCKTRTFLPTCNAVLDAGRSGDANRRAVYFAMECGIGYSGLEKFGQIFNLPILAKRSYYKQMDSVVSITVERTERELKEAGHRLREEISKENDSSSENDILDIAVSFDGTWAKRGHTSLFGIVYVISVDTGEVLDYEVLSKFCKTCRYYDSKKEDDFASYVKGMAAHMEAGNCSINYEGSSNAMEMEGASIIWKRSLEKHNFRYSFMVSDGDSKAFNKVSENNNYGDNCKIEKIDCIGHIQKRMGKRLLNLKSLTKGKLADGKSIGGRGRLTEATIKRIQRYYGYTIRQNTTKSINPTEDEKKLSVYQMKKNVMALLSHTILRGDLAVQHRYCPTGKKSWCAWQRDKELGTSVYNSKDCLPEVFMDLLKPIFNDLSSEVLLKRCVLGVTQNPNESINSLVWLRCPKHKFNGAKIVKSAAAAAILQFNGGATMSASLMKEMGTPANESSFTKLEKKNNERIKMAEKAGDEKEKRKRAAMQHLKIAREEALREMEGQSYGPGCF